MDPPVENDKTEHQKIDLSPIGDGPLIDFGEKSDVQIKTPNSTSSSSSSSSDDEEDDGFILLEGAEIGKPVSSGDVASSGLSGPSLFGDGPSEAPESNAQGDGSSPSSTQSPDLQDEPPNFPENLGIFQPAEPIPPAAEVMVRSDVPDPYRIPSSVFESSKSTAPMEWSVASNDSLFSIHMGGNSSFSRDHAILLGMSGELSSLPPLDLKKDPVQTLPTGETSSELTNSGSLETARERIDNEKLHLRSSTSSTPHSYQSAASTTSSSSFAFPILTKGPSHSTKVEQQKQNSPKGLKQPEGNEPQKPMVGSMAWWKSWCSCCSCTNCS